MNKSETIGALAAALAKAQGEMGAAIKDAANPFFKSRYADLAAVVDALKKPFASNGLSYVQTTDADETSVYVETLLMHSSGEWISGRLKMPVSKPNDPQALGSAMTYCRRYGLQAIAGIPADDDDGNAAAGKDKAPEQKPAAPDAEGKKLLEGAQTLAALAEAWKALPPAARATLGGVKDQCKSRLMKAEEATQA